MAPTLVNMVPGTYSSAGLVSLGGGHLQRRAVALGDTDQIQNIYDLRNERSLSTNCAPHRLVFSPIYDMPFGKGRHWLQRGPLSYIVGGWQVAMIGTLQSGSPFGVSVLNGPTNLRGDNSDGTILRANLVAGQMLYASTKGSPAVGVRRRDWLNPADFTNPAQYTFGNSWRTLPQVLGPPTINFDSLLAKNFRVGERWRAQFRWETFNMTNQRQLRRHFIRSHHERQQPADYAARVETLLLTTR